MADTEEILSPEDIQKLAIADDEDSPDYVPPKKVDIDTIKNMDANDESLVKYKKQLLGGVDGAIDEGGNNVLVKKLIIGFEPDEKQPDIVLDLTGDLEKLKDTVIRIKEGITYSLTIEFRVQRDIVAGLKFQNILFRRGIKVDKADHMVGSYGPQKEPHKYTCKDIAPAGMMARANYVAKSKFVDDDKNVYLEWEWAVKISKDWK